MAPDMKKAMVVLAAAQREVLDAQREMLALRKTAAAATAAGGLLDPAMMTQVDAVMTYEGNALDLLQAASHELLKVVEQCKTTSGMQVLSGGKQLVATLEEVDALERARVEATDTSIASLTLFRWMVLANKSQRQQHQGQLSRLQHLSHRVEEQTQKFVLQTSLAKREASATLGRSNERLHAALSLNKWKQWAVQRQAAREAGAREEHQLATARQMLEQLEQEAYVARRRLLATKALSQWQQFVSRRQVARSSETIQALEAAATASAADLSTAIVALKQQHQEDIGKLHRTIRLVSSQRDALEQETHRAQQDLQDVTIELQKEMEEHAGVASRLRLEFSTKESLYTEHITKLESSLAILEPKAKHAERLLHEAVGQRFLPFLNEMVEGMSMQFHHHLLRRTSLFSTSARELLKDMLEGYESYVQVIESANTALEAENRKLKEGGGGGDAPSHAHHHQPPYQLRGIGGPYHKRYMSDSQEEKPADFHLFSSSTTPNRPGSTLERDDEEQAASRIGQSPQTPEAPLSYTQVVSFSFHQQTQQQQLHTKEGQLRASSLPSRGTAAQLPRCPRRAVASSLRRAVKERMARSVLYGWKAWAVQRCLHRKIQSLELEKKELLTNTIEAREMSLVALDEQFSDVHSKLQQAINENRTLRDEAYFRSSSLMEHSPMSVRASRGGGGGGGSKRLDGSMLAAEVFASLTAGGDGNCNPSNEQQTTAMDNGPMESRSSSFALGVTLGSSSAAARDDELVASHHHLHLSPHQHEGVAFTTTSSTSNNFVTLEAYEQAVRQSEHLLQELRAAQQAESDLRLELQHSHVHNEATIREAEAMRYRCEHLVDAVKRAEVRYSASQHELAQARENEVQLEELLERYDIQQEQLNYRLYVSRQSLSFFTAALFRSSMHHESTVHQLSEELVLTQERHEALQNIVAGVMYRSACLGERQRQETLLGQAFGKWKRYTMLSNVRLVVDDAVAEERRKVSEEMRSAFTKQLQRLEDQHERALQQRSQDLRFVHEREVEKARREEAEVQQASTKELIAAIHREHESALEERQLQLDMLGRQVVEYCAASSFHKWLAVMCGRRMFRLVQDSHRYASMVQLYNGPEHLAAHIENMLRVAFHKFSLVQHQAKTLHAGEKKSWQMQLGVAQRVVTEREEALAKLKDDLALAEKLVGTLSVEVDHKYKPMMEQLQQQVAASTAALKAERSQAAEALRTQTHELLAEINSLRKEVDEGREVLQKAIASNATAVEAERREVASRHAEEIRSIGVAHKEQLASLEAAYELKLAHAAETHLHENSQLLRSVEEGHKEAIRQLQEVHEAAAEEAASSHRKELEGLHMEYRSLLSQLEDEVATTRKQLEAEAQDRGRALREKDQRHALAIESITSALSAKEAEMRQLQAAHEDSLRFVAKKYELMIEEAQQRSLQEQSTAKKELSAKDEAMEELVAYQTFLETRIHGLEEELEQTANQHKTAMKQQELLHAEQLRQLDASAAEERKELQRQHAVHIEALTTKHEKLLREAVAATTNQMAEEYTSKIKKIEELHAVAMSDGAERESRLAAEAAQQVSLKGAAVANLLSAQKTHAEELQRLEATTAARIEAAAVAAERRAASEAARAFDEQVQQLEASHRAQVQTLHAAHVADVEKLSSDHEASLVEYTKRQQSVLSNHLQERERLYNDLTAQHKKDMLALQDMLSTKDEEARVLRADVQKLTSELHEAVQASSARASQSVQHVRDELTAAMAMHQSAMRALEADHRSDVEQLNKRFRQQLDEAEHQLKDMKMATASKQEELLDAKARLESLTHELQRRSKDYEQNIARLEEQTAELKAKLAAATSSSSSTAHEANERLMLAKKELEQLSIAKDTLTEELDQSLVNMKKMQHEHVEETRKLRRELTAALETVVTMTEQHEIQLLDARSVAQARQSETVETLKATISNLEAQLESVKKTSASEVHELRKAQERASVAARALALDHEAAVEKLSLAHATERQELVEKNAKALLEQKHVLSATHQAELEALKQQHTLKAAELQQQITTLLMSSNTTKATGKRGKSSSSRAGAASLVMLLQRPILMSWYHKWRREVTNKQFRCDYQELVVKEERARSQLLLLVSKFAERQSQTHHTLQVTTTRSSSATEGPLAIAVGGRSDSVATPASIVRSLHNSPSEDSLAVTPVHHQHHTMAQLPALEAASGRGEGGGPLTPEAKKGEFVYASSSRSSSALKPIAGNDSPHNSASGSKPRLGSVEQHVVQSAPGLGAEEVDALVLRGQQLLGRMTTSLASASTTPRAHPDGPIQSVVRSATTAITSSSSGGGTGYSRLAQPAATTGLPSKGRPHRREF